MRDILSPEHVREPAAFMTDVDGTAVAIAEQRFSWQNARKKDLPPLAGYLAFVRGTVEAGVPFMGFVSKRAPIREKVTNQAVAYIGLPSNTPRILAGTALTPWKSEGLKADTIVRSATGFDVFGFVDDKPHKVGAEILASISKSLEHGPVLPPVNIVLAVVDHDKTDEYLDKFNSLGAAYNASTVEVGGRDATCIRLGSSALTIVALEPYTAQEGQWFAGALQQVAA